MKIIGRFIKRGRGEEMDNGAILILAPDGVKILKQDMVYEIVDIMGEMLIREVGETHMDAKCWNSQIQDVMMQYMPVLTKMEAEDYDAHS